MQLTDRESTILRDICFARAKVLHAGDSQTSEELPRHTEMPQFDARQALTVFDFFCCAYFGNEEGVKRQTEKQRSMGPHVGGEYYDGMIGDYQKIMAALMQEGNYTPDDVAMLQNRIKGFVKPLITAPARTLYIADCHFYHDRICREMDNRGFSGFEEMNEHMIAQWNKKVTAKTSPRTCVVHPTGTGKSYIALQLIEDNPDARILYITSLATNLLEFWDKVDKLGTGSKPGSKPVFFRKVLNLSNIPKHIGTGIYYPLSTLMLAGIRDILIISTPEDTPRFEHLLGDGHQFGVRLSYKIQPSPDGLAQAFIIGEEFIGDDACAMILGDNIFYGNGFSHILKRAVEETGNNIATVFGYYVSDPERFGVVEFDENGKVLSVEEKPREPKSNYAITGLYFYPVGVSEKAKGVKPSVRGELEITTLNGMYLQEQALKVELLGRGFAWLDTGTMDSLVDAADFVRMIDQRQGVKISAPEEIAFRYEWVSKEELMESAERYGKSPYGAHLKAVADGRLKSTVRK